MKTIELKVARIGNSRGVRIPAATLNRYNIGGSVVMEERTEGILLRPVGRTSLRLSWEETAKEMQSSREDWSSWDAVASDGLDEVPWVVARPRRIAEKKPSSYAAKPAKVRARKK